jgi:hypothetical protein
MTTIRCATPRRRTRMMSVAGVLLLAGCGSPYAWNDYLDPSYPRGNVRLTPSLNVPVEVTGNFGNIISADELRSVVAEQIHAPAVVQANAGTTAQQGSSTPDEPATRLVWTFNFVPSASDVGTAVYAQARYYSDNALLSSAEGTGIITQGRNDPRLGELIADVAAQLFPSVPRGGPGRG